MLATVLLDFKRWLHTNAIGKRLLRRTLIHSDLVSHDCIFRETSRLFKKNIMMIYYNEKKSTQTNRLLYIGCKSFLDLKWRVLKFVCVRYVRLVYSNKFQNQTLHFLFSRNKKYKANFCFFTIAIYCI